MSLTRIGLLAGMSWQSSAEYYRQLNELVQDRVGGQASAPVTMWSVDFAEIESRQRAGDWPAQGRILADAARALEASGARAIALATNTLHLVADTITADLTVPFIDLIEVVAGVVERSGVRAVGLLGTGYTMASDLYSSRFGKYGIDVLVPDETDRQFVHSVIYDELVHGILTEASKSAYLDIVGRLAARGAGSVVLGCTEISMLIQDPDAVVPLLDTTRLHCQALADIIISGVRS